MLDLIPHTEPGLRAPPFLPKFSKFAFDRPPKRYNCRALPPLNRALFSKIISRKNRECEERGMLSAKCK